MNSPIIYGPSGATSLVPGGVTLPGATSGTLQIQPDPATTSHVLTMPAAQGAASTVLTNDGSGSLSWSPGGGSSPTPVVASYYSNDGAIPVGVIDFNQVVVDSNSAVTTGSGVWKFTVPAAQAGYYETIAQMYFPTGGSSQFSLAILVNGTAVSQAFGNNVSPFVGTVTTAALVSLAVGDIIQVSTNFGGTMPVINLPGAIINIKKVN